MKQPTFQFRALHPRFCLRVNGDCMEPLIYHGEYIEVDTTLTPEPGDCILAEVIGAGLLVKRYEPAPDGGFIVAINADVRFSLDGNCRIIGVVVSVVRSVERLLGVQQAA